jgi:hypothetical protein
MVSYGASTHEGARRSSMQAVKNLMVSHAGWTVVASRGLILAAMKYEYEGVTPGDSYGGESTGPYDTWESTSSILHNASWIMLKSPTSAAGTFYMLLGQYGGGINLDRAHYIGVSDQMFQEPVGSDLPLPAVGSRYGAASKSLMLITAGSALTYYAFFSGCSDDGSFIMGIRRSDWTLAFAGFYMFSTLDLKTVPAGCMPAVWSGIVFISNQYGQFASDMMGWSGLAIPNWENWVKQSPRTGPAPYPYQGVGLVHPQRGTTNLLQSDMPFDFEGKAVLYPAHFVRPRFNNYSDGSTGGPAGQMCGYLGRAPDFFPAPLAGNTLGDVLTDGDGNIRFYYLNSYYFNQEGTGGLKMWVPSTIAPVW